MKFIHCIDTAGSDEQAFPLGKLEMIQVTAATTVILSFHNTDDDEAEHIVTLTVTSGKSDEVGKWIIDNAASGRGGRFEISASSHSDITTVAFTKGT